MSTVLPQVSVTASSGAVVVSRVSTPSTKVLNSCWMVVSTPLFTLFL